MVIATYRMIRIFFALFVLIVCSCENKIKPPNPVAVELNNTAMALVPHLENLDSCIKAISLLDSATAIDRDYFLGYNNKLVFLHQTKQYKRAINTNNEMIRLRPDAHDLYLLGGYLYQRVGDTVAARRYMQKSLSICNSVLDTMSRKNRDFEMIVNNRKAAMDVLSDLK